MGFLSHGWSCRSGNADHGEGSRRFQSGYDARF